MIIRFLVALIISTVIVNYANPITVTPDEMADKVVAINGNSGSGVIVHSNDEYTLILTNFHVIAEFINSSGNFKNNKKPHITFKYVYKKDNGKVGISSVNYDCQEVYVDKKIDLAILRVDIGVELDPALITNDAEVGEDIYVISNPNNNYRTVVRGIISSKDRYTKNNNPMWQISGGITYGASGGGAFTMDGKLIAIVRSVDLHNTSFCSTVMFGDLSIHGCYIDTIPYMGFFIPPKAIKKFLLSTKFKDKFDYLK
jgi:S1-C subfamily serine protease